MDTTGTADAYATYASIYDDMVRDRKGTATFIRGLIEQHRPGAKHVLELGCGTGDILAWLRNHYRVTGIDSSPSMLARAKRKLPEHTFYAKDASGFHLDQKFDAIFCVGDALNRHATFPEWESLFDCARTQLKVGGIFIVEFITPERLKLLAERGLSLQPARNNYAFTKLTSHPSLSGRYNMELRVFLQKDPYSFSCHSSTVDLGAYPTEFVAHALSRHFVILDRDTPERMITGRTHLVCRKAAA